jgi:adenosylmethionine-8-amino-7-oxononanoate aminotransferase
MTNSINNIGSAGGVNTNQITPPNTNQVGTPNTQTVNALQSQLNNAPATTASVGGAPVATGSGISAADMKLFMDEVNKFCVQQGILTTPKATSD